MEPNEKIKDELRKTIIKKIKDLPYGRRAHIDKELLESLLFKKIVYNKDTGETLKLPIWSGDFLKKIDLSEVDFEDVSWSLFVEDTYDFPEEDYKEFMDKETYDEMEFILPKLKLGDRVNYSETNAKIDFKKSFEYKKKGRINIMFCNFSYVDLSNNTLDGTSNLFECNLSNTNIKFDISQAKSFGQFMCCDLTNIDLRNFSCDLFQYSDERSIFDDCILTNTGANFTFDLNSDYLEKRKNFNNYPSPETYVESGRWKEDICNVLPYITGCYINGKKVLSSEEVKELKEQKREEYLSYKRGLLNSVKNNLNNVL